MLARFLIVAAVQTADLLAFVSLCALACLLQLSLLKALRPLLAVYQQYYTDGQLCASAH